jgi:hypothetical protein
MAAEGHTSQEIAQALFVTTRTIDTHLNHAYTKLGINSRKLFPQAIGRHEEQFAAAARPERSVGGPSRGPPAPPRARSIPSRSVLTGQPMSVTRVETPGMKTVPAEG